MVEKKKEEPIILKKIILDNGKEKFINTSEWDLHIGINSGQPFENQWLFFDIDNKTEIEIEELARRIIKEECLRRIVIVNSTDIHDGWHLLSFSPKPYVVMIEIISKYGTDEKHLAKAQDNGYATIRVTPKDIKLEVFMIVNNTLPNQKLNFYDYDAEKAYLEFLRNSEVK